MKTITLSQAIKALSDDLLTVTRSMLMLACYRGEVRYVRENTILYVYEEDLEFLRAWFLERARLKDKEASIGKYDMDARGAIRKLAKERVRESNNARGQANTQALPGRFDGPFSPESAATQGGAQC